MSSPIRITLTQNTIIRDDSDGWLLENVKVDGTMYEEVILDAENDGIEYVLSSLLEKNCWCSVDWSCD